MTTASLRSNFPTLEMQHPPRQIEPQVKDRWSAGSDHGDFQATRSERVSVAVSPGVDQSRASSKLNLQPQFDKGIMEDDQ